MVRILLFLFLSAGLYLLIASQVLTGSTEALLLLSSPSDLLPFFEQFQKVYRETGIGIHLAYIFAVLAFFKMIFK